MFTWGVLSQDRNLTELAGICSNGGTCGLIRQSTKNLTNLKFYNKIYNKIFNKL